MSGKTAIVIMRNTYGLLQGISSECGVPRNRFKKRYSNWHIIMAAAMVLFCFCPAFGGDANPSVDEILQGVEQRYSGEGFSVLFLQKTRIKALDITDSAVGKLLVKYPEKMRWEYDAPEKHIIVTDGAELWIYKPEDRQVMRGRAPSFFGDGKGAGFLSDITQIRENFIVLPGEIETSEYVTLILMTKEKQVDLARIDLWISKETFDVVQVTTYNAYGDETRIEFSGYRLEKNLPESLFHIEIPEGVDVIQME